MAGIRVAIDATPCIAGRTGIALFVSELASALATAGAEPRLFAVGRALQPVPPGCRHFPVPSRIVHRSWRLGGPPRPERLVGGCDVVHATSLLPPPSRRPVVSTVHDLAALDHPELHAPRLVDQMATLVRFLDRADAITADSEATKQSLVREGVGAERITVVRPGLVALADPVDRRIVAEPYLLAVGEQMARKGLDVLIDAFAAADIGDVVLVHSGPPSTASEALHAQVDRLGLQDRVRFLGYTQREELAALYRDAEGLVYPSIAEGFGFPLLEAMAAGVPALVSDIAVLRELGRDGAAYAAAGDRDAWAAALEAFLDDEDGRRSRIARGRAIAAEFTWARCAAEMLEVYRRAMANP